LEPIKEETLRRTNECRSWVVYRVAATAKQNETNAVCEQGEWEAMETAAPGRYRLIRAGILNEGEAEQLARAPVV
jgi:hypothetical protein